MPCPLGQSAKKICFDKKVKIVSKEWFLSVDEKLFNQNLFLSFVIENLFINFKENNVK